VLTVIATLATGVLWGLGWVLAKWLVNTCPEQGVTASDGDFISGRLILVAVTMIWVVPPLVAAFLARRHRGEARIYLALAAFLLALGAWATVGLSSGELCLS
jgi:drug/metabolite transporter (DMT)-like permease